MKFLKYFNENKIEQLDSNISNDEIKKIIKRDCLKFLNEVDLKYPLYRGITNNLYKKIYKFDINKNRNPLNMKNNCSEFVNKAFKYVYGFPLRKQCIFTTGNFNQAISYGDVYYIFPIGNYEVYWSSKIKDLYEYSIYFIKNIYDSKINTIKNERLLVFSLLYSFYSEDLKYFYKLYKKHEQFLIDNYGGIDIEIKPNKQMITFNETLDFIDNLEMIEKEASIEWVKTYYTKGDIFTAINKKTEIMLTGNSYYLINPEFFSKKEIIDIGI